MIRLLTSAAAITVSICMAGSVAAGNLQSRLAVMAGLVADGVTEGPSGTKLAAVKFIPALYAARENRPVWDNPENVAALQAGIKEAVRQGFWPQDR